MRLWLVLHLLGFTLWLGGGFAAMIVGIASRREEPAGLGPIVRTQAAVHRLAIGPGALLTALSGLVLTFRLAGGTGEMAGFTPWLAVMQGAGLLGALVALLVAVPTAARLGRLEPTGPGDGYFDELRRRLRVVGAIHGVLGLVALVAGAMTRFGG